MEYRSSILLEAVSPKYKHTASVWIVCNNMRLSPPESLDRSSHGYFQILLDTDESPTLRVVLVLYHIPTAGAELATSTVYVYIAGTTDTGPVCPKLHTASGSYLEAVLMTLLSRFKDTTTATSTTVSIDWTEACILFRAASTKFKIQVRIIVESSNTVVRKRMSPITGAQSFCLTLFYSNTRTR